MQSIWEHKLQIYFQTNLTLDREAEEIRRSLMVNICPETLFNILDNKSTGLVTVNDFSNLMSQSNKPFNHDSLRRMIHYYDKDNDFALNYNEFAAFLLPKNKGSYYDHKNTIKVDDNNMVVFIQLILKELEIVMSLGDLAEEIKEAKEFITYDAFRAIAGDEKYITEKNMLFYLETHDIIINDSFEIAKLLYRYDTNFDGNITYNEFKDIFFPYLTDNSVLTPKTNSSPKYTSPSKILKEKSNKDTAMYKKQLENGKRKWLHFDYSQEEYAKATRNIYNEKETSMITNKLNSAQVSVFPTYFTKKSNNTLTSMGNLNKANCSSIVISNGNENNSAFDIHCPTFDNDLQIHIPTSPNRSGIISQYTIEKEKQILVHTPKELQNENSIHYSSSSLPILKINKEKKNYFLDLIKEIIVQETICEGFREDISRNSIMNLPDLFSYFDYSNRDYISMTDIQEILHNLSLVVTIDEIKLLYKKYDVNMDGYLDYKEFCELLLPKRFEYAKMLSNHLPPQDFTNFNNNALELLSKLFASLIKCEKSCEDKRKIMASYPGFSNYEIFELIKAKYANVIYQNDLSNFLKKNQIPVTTFDLAILMEHFDKDRDSQISFNEFIRELIPKA